MVRDLVGPITVVGEDAIETSGEGGVIADGMEVIAIIGVPFLAGFRVELVHVRNAAGLGAENGGGQAGDGEAMF